MSKNWDEILERARSSESNEWLADLMPELCSDATLDDPTRLRVLGNAVANNKKNQDVLAKSPLLLKLLRPDTLSLSVLYNFSVGNADGCDKLLGKFDDVARALLASRSATDTRRTAKLLLPVLAEEGDLDEVPEAKKIKLVLDGFIEFLLVDESLEINPQIISNFPKIYHYAVELQDVDDAVQIIGNITSHSNFGFPTVQDIEAEPSPAFFIIATNLSARQQDMHTALKKWPSMLDLALKYLGSDDADLQTIYLLRNLSRVEECAKKIANWEGFDELVDEALASDRFAEATVQLVGNVGQYTPVFHLLPRLAQVPEDPSMNAAMLVCLSQVCTQLAHTSEVDPDVLQIAVKRIVELLEITPALPQTQALWVKGSKALALLNKHVDLPDISHLKQSAPESEGVQANFSTIHTN